MSSKRKQVLFLKQEMELMQDSSFLKTKLKITEKVFQLLRNTEEGLKEYTLSNKLIFPEGVLTKTGKISKGEKYLDLPYLVLDYPRYFSNSTTFAFRTMFWWGNFFSCTLHLQGEMLDHYRNTLCRNLAKITDSETHFCLHNTPWEYHFEKDNYVPITEIPTQKLMDYIATRDFIKLSKKLPLANIEQLPQFTLETFESFCKQLL